MARKNKLSIQLLTNFLCCLLTLQSYAVFPLKGYVATENGKSIPNCSISLNNHPNETYVTATDGSFQIDCSLNDTLIFRNAGYLETLWVVKDTSIAQIELRPAKETVMTRKQISNLSASEVMEQMMLNWQEQQNYHNKGNSAKINIDADFKVKRNTTTIYAYEGNTNLIKFNNTLNIPLRDSIHRYQIDGLPEELSHIPGVSPVDFMLSKLFFNGPEDGKTKYRFGGKSSFDGIPVYQISFYTKRVQGFDHVSGYFLVAKSDFRILYAEEMSSNCKAFSNENNQMHWENFVLKIHFNSNTEESNYVKKVENLTHFTHSYNDVKDDYFYKNSIIVNHISPTQIAQLNKENYGKASGVLYSKK